MIADSLKLAEPHFRIHTDEGKSLKISECIYDMSGYEQLTDGILRQIKMRKEDPNLAPARDVLERVSRRELYCMCEEVLLRPEALEGAWWKEENAHRDIVAQREDVSADDVFVEVIKINYGMSDKNPVDYVNFYNAKTGDKGPIKSDKVSCLIPRIFQERYIRCYCREKSKKVAVKMAFLEWLKKCPQGGDPLGPATPEKTPGRSAADAQRPPAKRTKL